MNDSEKEICNDCENVITGTKIKFIWTKDYAQIARVDITVPNVWPNECPGYFLINIFKKSFESEAYLNFLRVIGPGVSACLKKVGFRLRLVTDKQN